MARITQEILPIFLHIPKTGGTSVTHHLALPFSPDQVLDLPVEWTGYHQIIDRYLQSLTTEQLAVIKAIGGHSVYYGVHKFWPDRQPYYFSFFRQPAAWAVSQYNFCRTLLDQGQRLKMVQATVLTESDQVMNFWSAQKFSPFLDNYVYRYLADCHFGTDYRRSKDNPYLQPKAIESTLAAIKSDIAKLAFVGLTETFNDDLLYLSWRFEVRRFLSPRRVSNKYFKPTLAEREKIAKLNYLDQIIYNYACQRRRDILADLGSNYSQAVNQMRRRQLGRWPIDIWWREGLLKQLYSVSAYFKYRWPKYEAVLNTIKSKQYSD